ncbi:MAG: spore maturation protein, partial [Bacilli bacterium]|nr:spore maturation protein [Bacilli bacterium]
IWGSFIVIGIVFSVVTGNISGINNEIIGSGNKSLELFMSMFPLMIVWSGIMNICKDAGILDMLARKMKPLFKIIFPELDSDDEALSYIASNLTINMLGIHNASTPFGLKAMELLQKKNKDKQRATRSMITFLVLNTSGVTLIATDVIAIRSLYNSVNPTFILVPTIIITITNTVFALLFDRFLWKVCRK